MTLGLRDRTGAEISLERWSSLHADEKYRQMAYDEVGPVALSTVWIGIETMPSGNIFESALLEEGMVKRIFRTYPSEADALAGHAELLAMLRATQWPDDG